MRCSTARDLEDDKVRAPGCKPADLLKPLIKIPKKKIVNVADATNSPLVQR